MGLWARLRTVDVPWLSALLLRFSAFAVFFSFARLLSIAVIYKGVFFVFIVLLDKI